jgi:hypothetical protein
MKVGVWRNSFRTGSKEKDEIWNRIRRVHDYHPEYTVKELSMICFCGKNVVERCLYGGKNER